MNDTYDAVLPAYLARGINTTCAGQNLPTVVPETWREGCASLWMSGGGRIAARYIDGSRAEVMPFELRLRCHGGQISDRLDVIKALDGLVDGAESIGAVCVSGVSKCAVYENGDEEYRAGLEIRR